jgi:hypothetical protein
MDAAGKEVIHVSQCELSEDEFETHVDARFAAAEF